jgi:hypothetical protein
MMALTIQQVSSASWTLCCRRSGAKHRQIGLAISRESWIGLISSIWLRWSLCLDILLNREPRILRPLLISCATRALMTSILTRLESFASWSLLCQQNLTKRQRKEHRKLNVLSIGFETRASAWTVMIKFPLLKSTGPSH